MPIITYFGMVILNAAITAFVYWWYCDRIKREYYHRVDEAE